MRPLNVFMAEMRLPLTRWDPSDDSKDRAQSGCAPAAAHPSPSWSLYASAEGALVGTRERLPSGVYLPQGIVLRTREVSVPSFCGYAILVKFTLLPMAASIATQLRTVMAQHASSSKAGIGVRSARDRTAPSSMRLAVYPDGGLRCGLWNRTEEVWSAPHRREPKRCVPVADRHRGDRRRAHLCLPIQCGWERPVRLQRQGGRRPDAIAGRDGQRPAGVDVAHGRRAPIVTAHDAGVRRHERGRSNDKWTMHHSSGHGHERMAGAGGDAHDIQFQQIVVKKNEVKRGFLNPRRAAPVVLR